LGVSTALTKKRDRALERHERFGVDFHPERFVGDTEVAPREVMRISLALHGSCTVVSAGRNDEILAGDVFLIRPGVRFKVQNAFALQCVSAFFPVRPARRHLRDLLDARALALILAAEPLGSCTLFSERYRTVASLLAPQAPGGPMGDLGRLLILLEAVLESASPEIQPVHKAVTGAITLFDDELAKDWSLPDLSGHFGLDPSYLARLFKSAVGLPPMAYLAMMRAEAAAELLSLTKLSCSTVGEMVGWDDPNYFSRRFKQHFGASPTSYRDLVHQ